MVPADVFRFTLTTFRSNRLRLGLMLSAMVIGVAAVVILASLGEAARRFVIGEFSALGTNLVLVFPGRTETSGGIPPLVGEAVRDLTIEDALALLRSPAVIRVAPINVGTAPVARGRLERDATVVGTTADMLQVRHMKMAEGEFLPAVDPRRAEPVVVLGDTMRTELFGTEPALGQWVRIGDRRFRVAGVLESAGESLGIGLSDAVFIPVASAQMLFDTPSLFRIMVEAKSRAMIAQAKQDVIAIIRDRHDGDEDVTVITQDAVLQSFDRILRALTLTVSGIASISLAVAGVLIMNVMLVAVSQRKAEIGLLKAVGASPRQILLLFLTEAGLLAFCGGLIGVGVGELGSQLVQWWYPVLPMGAPVWVIPAVLAVALLSGIIFGVSPARRAARLDPVQALARR
ncbi:MAG: peptide ABC transporter permease [Gammaproteobacteria bacterium RBG_16_57_12]|nr:MAG: peptide ABC transporter permease [Gammaproteobacteria bacterium RBG_16_57_12]